MRAARRIAIRAGWIVAFDGRGHRLLRDGVVVVEGERIAHVGRTFDDPVDETVDARDRVLTPGLITTHAHTTQLTPPIRGPGTWFKPSAPV